MSDDVPISIEGVCDEKFARVREAFAANFTTHGEVGAAVTIYVDGRKVVDLWGGHADSARTRKWTPDTLVNFFSIGKAITATCVLLLVQRGVFDLDAPVTRWWPAFGAAGKHAITLRQLMAHRAGMAAVRDQLPGAAVFNWAQVTEALAAQAPWWTPGARHGYHVNTFGYLLGEPVRRATGMTLGTLLRQEIAGPHEADVYIGLPESEHGRVAEITPVSPAPGRPPAAAPASPTDDEERMRVRMRQLAYNNPPGISGGPVNTPAWRLAEIPSTNGHGTARGVARFYLSLLNGAILAPAIIAEATREHAYGEDYVLGRPSRFGLGYQLTHKERPLGPNARAFGHFGAGGSLGFCDPDAKVAFGYVMNTMAGSNWQSPCARALLDAVYSN
jgi:CubicO group peptidase (beta-lactamase class C family)